jgi:hypothetical protein
MSIVDLVGILIVTTAIIFVFFTGFYIYNEISNKLNELIDIPKAQNITAQGRKVYDILISSIPFIFFSLGISAIILAFLIPAHPVFFPLSIILLSIFVLLSTVFRDVIYTFLTTEPFLSIANNYPMLGFIVSNLPYFIAVFGFILIIVMYSRTKAYE